METLALWHILPAASTFHCLTPASACLARRERCRDRTRSVRDERQAGARASPWALLAKQFRNVLVLTLLSATTFSAFLGHGLEVLLIAIIVLFAVLLGFVQEYGAERASHALRKVAAPTITVLRDGEEAERPARLRPSPRRRPHRWVAQGQQSDRAYWPWTVPA